jgi:hypothetical protein
MDMTVTRNEKMSHLPIERLAELGSGDPLPGEREHLAECAMCASELAAYERLVELAADEHRRIAPPLSHWGALRSALIADGSITTPAADTEVSPFAVRVLASAGRIAAALLLLGGATIFGRLTTGLPMQQALALGNVHFAGGMDSSGQASQLAMTGQQFTSTASALSALTKAQHDYDAAAGYLAVNDTSASETAPELYRARLAALDRMAETSLHELQQRPQDPIMNQVYLTTLGARNLTLNKLGTTLPVGTKLTRF